MLTISVKRSKYAFYIHNLFVNLNIKYSSLPAKTFFHLHKKGVLLDKWQETFYFCCLMAFLYLSFDRYVGIEYIGLPKKRVAPPILWEYLA